MATRLADWRDDGGRLQLELQPVRWALRLLEGGACDSLTALCVVRSADGRWLAGRRADWVSVWARRWALGRRRRGRPRREPRAHALARAPGGVGARARAPLGRGARRASERHDDADRAGDRPGGRRARPGRRARRMGLVAARTSDDWPADTDERLKLTRVDAVRLGPCDADRAGHAGAAQPAVAARVLRQVLLVVVLGVEELGRVHDLGRDVAVAGLAQLRLVHLA